VNPESQAEKTAVRQERQVKPGLAAQVAGVPRTEMAEADPE